MAGDVPSSVEVERMKYHAAFEHGYKAGQIAALREVGCQYGCARYADKRNYCSRCRLLAEAESGKDTAEVGE